MANLVLIYLALLVESHLFGPYGWSSIIWPFWSDLIYLAHLVGPQLFGPSGWPSIIWPIWLGLNWRPTSTAFETRTLASGVSLRHGPLLKTCWLLPDVKAQKKMFSLENGQQPSLHFGNIVRTCFLSSTQHLLCKHQTCWLFQKKNCQVSKEQKQLLTRDIIPSGLVYCHKASF